MKSAKEIDGRLSRFRFELVRGVLMGNEVSQDGDYRRHLRWMVANGLVDDAGGLTRKGVDHRELVSEEPVFRWGLERMRSTFGGNDWAWLITVLRARAKRNLYKKNL